MIDFFLTFFTVVLVLVGLFSMLIVLMQRSSSQPGMGAAMGGGGVADQAFGADSGNVLTRVTQTTTIIFFVLSFLLYLGFQARFTAAQEEVDLLPDAFEEQESTAPAPGHTDYLILDEEPVEPRQDEPAQP